MNTYSSVALRQWLNGVGAIATAVNASMPLPELLDLIADTACALTGYDASAVLVPDEHGRALIISGAAGLPANYVADVNDRRTVALDSGPLSEGPSTRAFRQQTYVAITDILADGSFAPWADLAHRHGYRAIASVPLVIGDESVGTLTCYRSEVHEFGEDELTLLATLAKQAATALQSSRTINSLTRQRALSEQAEAIHRELTGVALRAGGVQGVADTLVRLLGRPVLITDANNAVVATAAHRGVQLAPARAEDAGIDGEDPDRDEADRVSVQVLLGSEVVARLWLTGPADELSELDMRAIEHAALVCSLEFVRMRTADEVELSLRADLLTDLLSGTPAEELTTRAAALGHDLTIGHTVLVAATDDPPTTESSRALLRAVRGIASRSEPRPLLAAVGGHVVALWPETVRGLTPVNAADYIRSAARRAVTGSATVIVGRRCGRIEEASAAVGTARGALELARLHGTDRTLTLPDLGIYGLLLQLDDPTELVGYSEQVVGPLREYDGRKNARLLDTVRAYLDHGMSVASTAEALFVHPNTVGLRLKRVEQLVGFSLQPPEALLRLKVALMADEVLGGKHPLRPETERGTMPRSGRLRGSSHSRTDDVC